MERWIYILSMVNSLLDTGYGPSSQSGIYNAIPGIVEDDDIYYAVIVDENGKPVDWYGYAFNRPNFTSGFGGWYTMDSKDFLEACLWVKDVMKEVA